MKSLTSVRLRAGLIAFALVLSQVVMPVQSAFAVGGPSDKETGKPDEPKKVYVCKYVGTPGVDERLKKGNDGLIEVAVNSIENNEWDGTLPGYFSDKQDRSYVLEYVTDGQSAPAVTQCPGVVDVARIAVSTQPVCGPNNDMVIITPSELAGVTYSQSSWVNNSLTVSATLQAGFSWSDDTEAATKNYILTDDAAVCEREVLRPTPLTVDPCGINNASWATQEIAAEYTWSVVNGRLIVTANPGFYFMVQGEKATSIDYGFPVDANLLCPVVLPCVASTGSEMVTMDSQFADYQDTRSKGHYEFTDQGLRIYTDDSSSQAKVAWYNDVTDYSLALVGSPSIDYTSTVGIKAGMQIVLDKDGDGDSDGILVGEPDAYGSNWWSNADFGVGSGSGYTSYGTLTDYLVANPVANVMAVGFSLGSGVLADGVLKSLTFGCYTWTFKKAPRVPSVCTVTDNMYDRVWKYDGDNFPQAGADPAGTPGSFDFQDEGLYLNTPAIESYAYGFIDAGNTPMIDVDAMSYKVLRQAKSAGFEATLPAYILLVDTNGSAAGGIKYFFYEPYNNDQTRAAVEGSFQTWDALAAGNAKWYMSGTGQTVKTWSSFVAEFPEAVVLAYGFNQGTYNAETYSVVQDIEFDCATTSFRYFQGMGGVGGETPVTPTPSVPTAGSGATEQPLLPAELPMTGSGGMLSTWFALLAAILTYGAVLYLQPKKRLEE